MNWTKVTPETMPNIPNGYCEVPVILSLKDKYTGEKEVNYGIFWILRNDGEEKPIFEVWEKYIDDWLNVTDEVTHWMPWPKPAGGDE